MSVRPAPIVMVHGAFCGGWTFDALRTPFEAAGHTVICPDLRGHGADAPASAVGGLSMLDYASDIADLCKSQDQPPILVGHSMGGLVAQLAAARSELRALVLLAPSGPWGVAGSSMEEAVTALGVAMVGPFWNHAVTPDRALMRNFSLDRVPRPQRSAMLDRLSRESGRAVWETLNWWADPFMTTRLPPGPLPAPSLAMVGERDVVHPPATVRQTAERIGAEFRLMPGMSHWLPGEPGWEDVADGITEWLSRAVRAAA